MADSIEVISPKKGTVAKPLPVPLDGMNSFVAVIQVDVSDDELVTNVWATTYTVDPPPPEDVIDTQQMGEVGGAGSGSDCYSGQLFAECDTAFGISVVAEIDDNTGAALDPIQTNTGLVYTGDCSDEIWMKKMLRMRAHKRKAAANIKAAKKSAKRSAKKQAGKKKNRK